MKKLLSLFICLLMLLQMIPLSVLADSVQEYNIKTDHFDYFKSTKAVPTRSPSFDKEKLKQVLFDGFYECKSAIDISSLGIAYTSENMQAIKDLMYLEMPECFHLENSYSYSYSSKIIAKIYPYYKYSGSVYQSMHAELVAVKNKLVQGIKGNNNLDDVEKALLLHDRLAVVCQYDYSYSEIGATTYGAMVNGAAVCQGYAEAYYYLLDEVGIKSDYCQSNQLNHIWNIVYINNTPYHVDVTWDDIAWMSGERGAVGVVDHVNFLRSSSGIYATGHNTSDYDTTPKDTTYDNYFWQNSNTAFELIDNELYYIDNVSAKLKRYSDKKELCSVSSQWFYYGNQARLSGDGRYLYYSLADAVYQYDPGKGTSTKIFAPSLNGNNKIYGFTYQDDYLVCDISDAPPYYSNRTVLYQIKEKYSTPSVGTVEIWNIALDSDITAKFYLSVDSSNAKVKITLDNESVIRNVSTLNKVNGLYEVQVKLAAAQMNDSICIQVINGADSGEIYTYSVRQYCDTVLADKSQSAYHTLVKEMLNYGAMAQVFFNHQISNLANINITGMAATAVPKTAKELAVTDKLSSLDFYGASLGYRDRIAVRYYFTGNVTGCTFKVNGKIYTPVAKDGMYYVEIADILPQNLDQQITLTVTNSKGSTLTVTYGPMNYMVRMNQTGDKDTQNLMKALYNYHLAAKKMAA